MWECFLCTSAFRLFDDRTSDTWSRGLALESMVTLLTPKFIPFFMLVWIISAY